MSLTLIAVVAVVGIGYITLTLNRFQQARVYMGVIALVLFVGVIALTTSQVQSPTSSAINASSDIVPQNVTFHQVNKETLTVTWHTDKPVIGGIKVSTDATQDLHHASLFDQTPTTEHLHRIPAIAPGQTYYFTVLSNNQWFQFDGKPLQYTIPKP
jgi:hypothetical protein